jgi:hypothetical protein
LKPDVNPYVQGVIKNADSVAKTGHFCRNFVDSEGWKGNNFVSTVSPCIVGIEDFLPSPRLKKIF